MILRLSHHYGSFLRGGALLLILVIFTACDQNKPTSTTVASSTPSKHTPVSPKAPKPQQDTKEPIRNSRAGLSNLDNLPSPHTIRRSVTNRETIDLVQQTPSQAALLGTATPPLAATLQAALDPDYEAAMRVSESLFVADEASFEVTIEISELNGIENNESNLSFAINKNSRLTLLFDPTQTQRGAEILNNPSWCMQEDSYRYLFSYCDNTTPFPAATKQKIGLHATFAIPPHKRGKLSLGLHIRDSAADSNRTNNYDGETIGYAYSANGDQPPVITLNGDENITIYLTQTYIEEGATATDAEDGNLSVLITGDVNTTQPGLYELIYMATDSSGNVANKTRYINVIPPPSPSEMAREFVEAYLANDDATMERITSKKMIERLKTVDTRVRRYFNLIVEYPSMNYFHDLKAVVVGVAVENGEVIQVKFYFNWVGTHWIMTEVL